MAITTERHVGCSPRPGMPVWQRLFVVALVTAVAIVPGCGGSSGELLVSIATDLDVPKDINAIRVNVTRDGKPDLQESHKLGAGGSTLPIVFSLKPRKDGTEVVKVQVTGWQGDKLRVLRTA